MSMVASRPWPPPPPLLPPPWMPVRGQSLPGMEATTILTGELTPPYGTAIVASSEQYTGEVMSEREECVWRKQD